MGEKPKPEEEGPDTEFIRQLEAAGIPVEQIPEEKPELLSKEFPIMVHRWFPDGEGWAYHPSLSGDKFMEIINGISKELNELPSLGNNETQKGFLKITGTEDYAVFALRRDITSKDPKAKNRNPSYLTLTVIAGDKPTSEQLNIIYNEMENAPEVEQRGQSEALIIRIK